MGFSGFVLVAGLTVALTSSAVPAQAETNPDTVLRVIGDFDLDGQSDTALFTRDDLRAIEEAELDTSTIWTSGIQHFHGVHLKSILERLGIDNGELTLSAANDYSISLPVSEITAKAPLIAYERNGEAMTLRALGPLWVIYPYDSSPEYRNEVVYSRSVWQLQEIQHHPF